MLDQILGPLCIIDFSAIELYIMESEDQVLVSYYVYRWRSSLEELINVKIPRPYLPSSL